MVSSDVERWRPGGIRAHLELSGCETIASKQKQMGHGGSLNEDIILKLLLVDDITGMVSLTHDASTTLALNDDNDDNLYARITATPTTTIQPQPQRSLIPLNLFGKKPFTTCCQSCSS